MYIITPSWKKNKNYKKTHFYAILILFFNMLFILCDNSDIYHI